MNLDEDTYVNIVLCLLAICLFSIGVVVIFSMFTEQACLEHGYPSGKVTYTLKSFCVKRVNQTDVVVPLGKALNE